MTEHMNVDWIWPELLTEDAPYELSPELTDFRKFYWYVLKTVHGFEPSRIQLDWCHWLQNTRDDIMLQAPREEGKSMSLCIYPVWRLLLNPKLHFVIVSENEDKASRNSGYIKQIMAAIPETAHMLPKRGQRDSVLKWDTAYADVGLHASIQCYGVSGGIVGAHGHELLVDDVETQKNSASAPQRLTLRERVDGLNYIPYRDIEGTRKIFIGTPHSEESVYNDLPKRGCRVLVYPRQYGFHEDHYFGEIAPMFLEDLRANPSLKSGGAFDLGKSTDPVRAPDSKLLRDTIKTGRSSWMLQMQLDPRAGLLDAYPLKIADLVVADVDVEAAPNRTWWSTRNPLTEVPCLGRSGDMFYGEDRAPESFTQWDRKIAFVDPSGRGLDCTSCAILFLKNGTIYLYDMRHFPGGYDEETVLKPMAKWLSLAGPLELFYEDNFGDGMFGALMAPIVANAKGIVFDYQENGVRASTMKEARIISSLEPVLNAHRLVVSKKALESDYRDIQMMSAGNAAEYSFIYQMARITPVKNSLGHDDGLDALAHGVQILRDYMAVDQAWAASVDEEMRLQEELEKEREEWRGALQLSPGVVNEEDLMDPLDNYIYGTEY